jgi:hypothetical protein
VLVVEERENCLFRILEECVGGLTRGPVRGFLKVLGRFDCGGDECVIYETMSRRDGRTVHRVRGGVGRPCVFRGVLDEVDGCQEA